jgi:hypothetical protein
MSTEFLPCPPLRGAHNTAEVGSSRLFEILKSMARKSTRISLSALLLWPFRHMPARQGAAQMQETSPAQDPERVAVAPYEPWIVQVAGLQPQDPPGYVDGHGECQCLTDTAKRHWWVGVGKMWGDTAFLGAKVKQGNQAPQLLVRPDSGPCLCFQPLQWCAPLGQGADRVHHLLTHSRDVHWRASSCA